MRRPTLIGENSERSSEAIVFPPVGPTEPGEPLGLPGLGHVHEIGRQSKIEACFAVGAIAISLDPDAFG